MKAFVDCLSLAVQAGHGGGGSISFRRRRNSPRGPADGGDGGDGGSVRLRCSSSLKTLSHFRAGKLYRAEDGEAGSKDNCHGHRGEDLVLEVPPGTVLTRLSDGVVVAELNRVGEERPLLRGGRGGHGNAFFTSSRMRSPRFSQPGEEGQVGEFRLELKLLADVALVGFPNAGKSYLQNNLTRARPKVADYPFSTRTPNLGVLRVYDRDVVLADIPGLLAGAAAGVGLGQRFLSHIARTTWLALLVDVSEPDFMDKPDQLLHELRSFSAPLAERCALIVATKLDLPGALENLAQLQSQWQRCPVLGISNVSGAGLEELKRMLLELAASANVSAAEAVAAPPASTDEQEQGETEAQDTASCVGDSTRAAGSGFSPLCG